MNLTITPALDVQANLPLTKVFMANVKGMQSDLKLTLIEFFSGPTSQDFLNTVHDALILPEPTNPTIYGEEAAGGGTDIIMI